MLAYKFSIEEIIQITGGKFIQIGNNQEISGINTDSRTIQDGECFIAIRGEQFDGHDFISDVCKKNIPACIVEKNIPSVPESISVIQVDSTIFALEKIAQAYSHKFSVKKIAITGSMGKTTTKEIIYQILNSVHPTLKTPKSFNNNIGLPLTLLELKPEHKFAVLEIGGNHLGEIKHLSSWIQPHIAIITCIAPCHIEGFGSLAGVEQAKGEILEGLQSDATLIINADDPACCRIAKKFGGHVLSYGLQHGDICVSNLQSNNKNLSWKIDSIPFYAPVVGKHNIYNIMAAIAVAKHVGLSISEIRTALESAYLPPMRLETQKICDVIFINDAYNANPKAMAAALDHLQEYPTHRKIAILGSMRELGQEAQYWHHWLGTQTYNKVDILFALGDESVDLAKGACEAGIPTDHIYHYKQPDDAALSQICSIIKPRDVILLKASRKLQLEKLYQKIKERFA